MTLSERVRPDSEAAPWVIEEIKQLEAAIEKYKRISIAQVGVIGRNHAATERLVAERDAALAEVEHLRKLLNSEPKPDPSDTLLRRMKAEQRREIYRQAWEAAILEGKERNEAHRIAAEAADAVVSLEEI